MKLAASNIAFAFDERLHAYAALREAGFTGLEIAPGLLFADAPDGFAPDDDVLAARKAEAARYGLSLCSMQSLIFGRTGCALFGSPEERETLRAAIAAACALAGRLGIGNMVFGSPKARVIPADMRDAEARAIANDFFGQIAETAAACDTVIALEANPAVYGTNFMTDFDASVATARDVDHSAIRVNFDVGSFLLNEQADDLARAFTAQADIINHVHISEPFLAPAPSPATEAVLRPLFKALADASYDGYVSIEMRRAEGGVPVLAEHAMRVRNWMSG